MPTCIAYCGTQISDEDEKLILDWVQKNPARHPCTVTKVYAKQILYNEAPSERRFTEAPLAWELRKPTCFQVVISAVCNLRKHRTHVIRT